MTRTSKNQSTTNIEFLKALNKYIPSLVLQQLITRTEKASGQQKLPELQRMETAVLFADISGFTMLGEACAKQGVRGNEELAFCINRYMEGMVKILGKYGGDIIKFVGDALIVMWPEEKGSDAASMTVRKAIQCSLDIQKEMNNFQVITGVSALSVKIGLGYGKCALLYVGGVFNRAEFFTVGSALTYALKSEGQAVAGGQIIVSETAFRHVPGLYAAKEIISHPEGKDPGGEKFYLIEKLIGQGIMTRADALQIRSQISNETYHKISSQLRGCVPAAIIPYLQIGAEQFGSETRSLTVMFASLGVELSSAETQSGMELIQKVVTCVQECVYRHQGSVNKLVMDDKGSTLVCLWGLSPMAHEDDAARAILTAFEMRRELMRLYNTTCNIGISSGEMFSGVVGTSGGRKEFSVLGDVANLAARIMYWPIKRKLKGMINVDLNTRTLASNFFSYKYVSHSEFKGKSISIPIFEPYELVEELSDITKKPLHPGAFLKPHMNPMNLEPSTNNAAKLKMVGSAVKQVETYTAQIVKYFQSNPQRPFLAAIKGEIGSGKSLFARQLVESLVSNDEFKQMMRIKNQLFCSSLNPESQYSFLNSWRPILVQLLTFYCKRENNIRREQVVLLLLSLGPGGLQANEKFTSVFCEMLNTDKQAVYKVTNGSPSTQVAPQHRMFPFVQREQYKELDQILDLVLLFIRLVIGEFNHDHTKVRDETPIILLVDTVHLMDAPSWKLYALIRDNCKRIAVVLMQRCDNMGELVIHEEARPVFKQVWYTKSMDQLHQYELPCLDQQSLKSLLLSMANKYKKSYMEEVVKMTDIVPDIFYPAGEEFHTIKDKAVGDAWVKRLSELWQLSVEFTEIAPVIITTILRRCNGNPLLCLSFFVILIQNSFLKIESTGRVVSTEKFDECIKLNDFLTCPAPRIAIKQNLALIDKFVQSVYSKANKRPGELEFCMRSIVMMKAATVLGDEFDSKSLQALYPLKQNEQISELNKMLRILEANSFIEIVDEMEQDNNLKYRFSKPFLRESVYQVVLFRDQKQGIHGAASNYLLQNEVEGMGESSNSQLLVEILKKHMLIAEDVKEEGELSLQARTGLEINRIKNKLDANPHAFILKEDIYKQGQAANKKTSKRLCTIDSTYFRWYHNEKELLAGTYLGSVPIQFIYQTVSSKLAWLVKPSFSISTTQWFDKHQAENRQRDFYFACDEVLQMEKWIITIEFLRTKAVYDSYARKNVPVNFPIMAADEQSGFKETQDHSHLLYDFGSSLKQKTQLKQYVNYQSTSNVKRDSRMTPRQSSTGVGGPSDLLQKLKSLYGVSIISFTHHLQQTAAKVTVSRQSACLGQLPDKSSAQISDKLEGLLVREFSRHETMQRESSMDGVETQSHKRQPRTSSISADQVSNIQVANQYIKSDLIHEETEGQTSEDATVKTVAPPLIKTNSDKLRRSQIVSQDLRHQVTQNNDSDFARLTQESPLSTARNEQREILERNRQNFFSSTNEQNRLTFAANSKEVVVALLNTDERLDELSGRSPAQRMHATSHSVNAQSPDRNYQSNSTQERPDLSQLHEYIKQSIDSGLQRLMQQNEVIQQTQHAELSQIIKSQHQVLLNQTLSQASFINNSHGATSLKQKLVETPVKTVVEDEPLDPISPAQSPERGSSFSQLYQRKSVDQMSVRTVKRSEAKEHWVDRYQDFEQPIAKPVNDGVPAICNRDSCCQQNKYFKITAGTPVKIIETLMNFKLYRVQLSDRQGLFLMSDFTKVLPAPITKISPIKGQNNFFMELSHTQVKDDASDQQRKNLKMLDRLQKKKRRKSAKMV